MKKSLTFAATHCAVAACLLAAPLSAGAQAAWMPDYGEAETGLTVTSITSLHQSGPDVPDEEGMPKGWPAAADPAAPPLFAQGDGGQFLLMPARGTSSGIVRTPTVPSHYQVEIPYPLFQSGTNRDPDAHRSRMRGNLVQRANGDILGIVDREANVATSWPASPTGFYRLDFDGTHGSLIESTLGKLTGISGVLVVDGNRVYGTDLGEDGNGRLFRLNEDDTIDFLHAFGPGPDGQPQMPNGFIVGSDGKIYGLVAYHRGLSFEAGTSTAPQTPTGALYRLDPDVPGSYTVLKTLTLAEGELVSADRPRLQVSNREPFAYNWPLEVDGWIYGTTGIGQCGVPANSGRRHHPLCGWQAQSPHWLTVKEFPYYDVPDSVFGAVWRVRADGSDFQVVHRFSFDDGATPRGPLALGTDGAIYGTTLAGGMHESMNPSRPQLQTPLARGRWFDSGNLPYDESCQLTDGVCRLGGYFYNRDGVLYRIQPERIQVDAQGKVTDGGFELVHHFRFAETGKTPMGVVSAPDGRLYGATAFGGGPWVNEVGWSFEADDNGTIFAVGAESEAVVTLTVTPAETMPGTKVELTWTSFQAKDCVASSSLGDWKGSQPPQGSIDLTPAESGVYNYSLVCIDEKTGLQVSALQVLRVNTTPTQSDGNTVEYNSGGSASLALLALLLLAGSFSRRARAAAAVSLTGVKA